MMVQDPLLDPAIILEDESNNKTYLNEPAVTERYT